MRRIVAILLLVFVVFWIAYGLFEPWRTTVNAFMINVAGPTVWNTINGIGTSPFWMQYGSFIMLGAGVIFGIVIYSFWHKADWRLRRWGAARTATDLGTQPVSQFPATPPGATTRPETTKEVVAKVEAVAPKEPIKKESTTA